MSSTTKCQPKMVISGNYVLSIENVPFLTDEEVVHPDGVYHSLPNHTIFCGMEGLQVNKFPVMPTRC